MADIALERVREVLRYEPESGLLFWQVSLSNRAKAGAVAGYKSDYVRVNVDGRSYKAHRLIWFMVTGIWPVEVDHGDGDGTNNRWTNLKDCTHAQNHQNLCRVRRNNPTGLTGAYWDKRDKRWFSSIGIAGKQVYLGTFQSAEQANSAYVEAKKLHHQFCGELRGGNTTST